MDCREALAARHPERVNLDHLELKFPSSVESYRSCILNDQIFKPLAPITQNPTSPPIPDLPTTMLSLFISLLAATSVLAVPAPSGPAPLVSVLSADLRHGVMSNEIHV